MSKNNRNSFFWTGYSDLMTSLFFVMLVLFVLTLAHSNKKINLLREGLSATKQQIEKIKEIEEAIKGIDSTYFDYNTIYKKHVLKISVNFPIRISEMDSVDSITRDNLKKAGRSIINSLKKISDEYPGIQYLLVIEGQASKDSYPYNYELSYNRALSLSRFWNENGVYFGDNCEVLISGSGIGGTMREEDESKNQRFLIHLIPKPGIIEASKELTNEMQHEK